MFFLDKIADKAGLLRRNKQFPLTLPQVSSTTPTFNRFKQAVVPDSYTDDYFRVYKSYAWVYSAVSAIARNFSMVPIRFFQDRNDGMVDVSKEEVFQIFYKPNPFQTKTAFWHHHISNLELAGENFWLLVRDDLGVIRQMYILRPDRIEIVPDEEMYIKGFLYVSKTGKRIPISKEDMVFWKYPDPQNEYRGLSPLSAARNAVLLDLNAISYSKDYFKNAIRPTGVLELGGDMPLSDSQFDTFKQRFENQYQGLGRNYKVILLEMGAKYTPLSLPPKDMEFIQQKKWSKDEVLSVFGVPPAVITDFGETAVRANTEEQFRFFWQQTLQPKLIFIQEVINDILQSFFMQSNVKVEFDTSDIMFLQEDLNALTERLSRQFNDGAITLNEYRDELGKPPLIGGDTTFIPATLLPFGSPAEESRLVTRMLKKNYDSEDWRTAKWHTWNIKALPVQRSMQNIVSLLFRRQEKKIIDKLMGKTAKSKKGLEEDITKIVNDIIEEEAIRFGDTMRGLILEAIRQGGEFLNEQIGREGTINLVSSEIVDHVGEKLIRYGADFGNDINVHKTTLDGIIKELKIGIQADETIDQIASRISNVYKTARVGRASAIAQTETTAAINRGITSQMGEMGVRRKMWISSRDTKVRDAHTDADGQIVGARENFHVGGENLQFPGDGEIASNNINCRCGVIPIN